MQRISRLVTLHLAGSFIFFGCGGTGFTSQNNAYKQDLVEEEGPTNLAPLMKPIGDRKAPVGKVLVIAIEASDPDNDPLQYFVVGRLPRGAMFDDAKGVFSWMPEQSQLGMVVMLTFGVSDGLHKVSQSVMIEVVETKENHKPDLAPVGSIQVEAGKTFEMQLSATDPDGDELRFFISGFVPEGARLDEKSGVFRWDVPKSADGMQFVVLFGVSDGEMEDTEEALFVVGKPSGNRPPQVQDPGDQIFVPEKKNSVRIVASDPDNDPLTFAIRSPSPPYQGMLMENDVFSWTPEPWFAGSSINCTIGVSDGTHEVVARFNVFVKDIYPPMLALLGEPEVEGGKAFVFVLALDETGIEWVNIQYHTDVITQDKTEAMIDLGDDYFGAEIDVSGASRLELFVTAMDGASNVGRLPSEGYYGFDISSPCADATHILFARVYYDTLATGAAEKKEEFVWLYNPTSTNVDLSGYGIADACGNGRIFVFPDNVSIAPHSYLQLARDKETYQRLFLGTLTPDIANFSLDLNNDGDCLLLLDSDVNVVDAVCWEKFSDCSDYFSGTVSASPGEALARGRVKMDGQFEPRFCDRDLATDFVPIPYDSKPLP